MLGITKVRISPNLPLIGKDLDAGATLNADVVADVEDLLAGTIMAYTFAAGAPGNANGIMTKATRVQIITVGPSAPPAGIIIGILAADSFQAFDNANVPINRPAMIYRKGTFIRSTINEINALDVPPGSVQPPILPGDDADQAMNLRGLHLEESWDANILDVPPPIIFR